MIKKILIATLVAGSLGGVALPTIASEVVIRVAPPELRIERTPEARRGYVWVPGYWDWRGHRHVWVQGSWTRERPGYMYQPPVWVQHDGSWHMRRGQWDEDHDGIPNRLDRDRDGDGVPNRRDRQPDNPNRK